METLAQLTARSNAQADAAQAARNTRAHNVAPAPRTVRPGAVGPCVHRAVAHQGERLDAWRRLLAAYDVERQLAIHPVGPARLRGIRHVGDAHAAAHLIAVSQGNLLPFFFLRGPHPDLAAEGIRIGTLE